jgi:hypothetical protein
MYIFVASMFAFFILITFIYGVYRRYPKKRRESSSSLHNDCQYSKLNNNKNSKFLFHSLPSYFKASNYLDDNDELNETTDDENDSFQKKIYSLTDSVETKNLLQKY